MKSFAIEMRVLVYGTGGGGEGCLRLSIRPALDMACSELAN
jgi:hypothetical protein